MNTPGLRDLVAMRVSPDFYWRVVHKFSRFCLRHQTCLGCHGFSGARYRGYVSPKLHVSTNMKQQHCWWFQYELHHVYIPITRYPFIFTLEMKSTVIQLCMLCATSEQERERKRERHIEIEIERESTRVREWVIAWACVHSMCVYTCTSRTMVISE